jgi:hypothetical protein
LRCSSDESGEHTKAREGWFDGDRLHDVSGNKHFQAEQKRSADARFELTIVLLLQVGLHEAVRRPDNANDDDGDAKYVDPITDEANPMADALSCTEGTPLRLSSFLPSAPSSPLGPTKR